MSTIRLRFDEIRDANSIKYIEIDTTVSISTWDCLVPNIKKEIIEYHLNKLKEELGKDPPRYTIVSSHKPQNFKKLEVKEK